MPPVQIQHAVVVLGHASPDGVIDKDCHLRMGAVLTGHEAPLHLMRPATALVLSGGCKAAHPCSEAQQMHDWLTTHELAPHTVLLEEWSRTTAENAWCVVHLLADAYPHLARITIICSHAHSVRSRIFFRRALREAGMRVTLEHWTCAAPGVAAWWYEVRCLHHMRRNITAARARRDEMPRS